jgi:DNA-binding CsgD family transcriptional regulator
LQHSECFHDFFEPRGMVHVLGAIIRRDGSAATNLSVQRSVAAGPFTRAERDLVGQLMPHMQRVVQIHQRLTGAERTGPLAETLDRLPTGLILVDGHGRALFVNRAALEISRAGDGLTLSRPGLSAARPSDNAALHRLIAASVAQADDHLPAGGTMSVSRPSLKRPYLVVVAPIRGSRHPWPASSAASAAVFVSDPERGVPPPVQWLRAAYGLTAAEARLAGLLAAGVSLDEAAGTLRVTRETARCHLKRLFDKTDTRRQSALIALILRASAGLPSGGCETGG